MDKTKKVSIIAASMFLGLVVGSLGTNYTWSLTAEKMRILRSTTELGGRVRMDFECDELGSPSVAFGSPKPKNSIFRFGYCEVAHLDLRGVPEISDRDNDSLVGELLFRSPNVKEVILPSWATDQTILNLLNLKNLKKVSYFGDSITDAGWDRLKANNPNLKCDDNEFFSELYEMADEIEEALQQGQKKDQ